MDSTGSFLLTTLERIRAYMDSDESEKYSDSFLINHIIGPSMVDVLSRLNMDADNPIMLRHSLSTVQDVRHYQLPPCIGEIWRLVLTDDSGNMIAEEIPRGLRNPCGRGWSIEGNLISFDPMPQVAMDLQIWYTSNGDVRPHYSADGGTLDSTRLILTLDTSPDLGILDRREQAYAGQVLRMIPASGTIEERVITSHDVSAGTVTVKVSFSADTATGATKRYEIAPIGSEPLYEAISVRGALKLGAMRNISGTKRGVLIQELQSSLKSISDNLANMQARTGKYFDRTGDNTALWRM